MTTEQISASRDYNLTVLWFWNRRAGIKPAQLATDHEKLLAMWFDRTPQTPSELAHPHDRPWKPVPSNRQEHTLEERYAITWAK